MHVPWQISPSVPHLRVVQRPLDLASATFIGNFLCGDPSHGGQGPTSSAPQVVAEPPDFRPAGPDENACVPNRLVKVSFIGASYVRVSPAVSDVEVLREQEYDWSEVSSEPAPGEGIREWLQRYFDTWWKSRTCPNPGMYDVSGSTLLSSLGLVDADAKHLILVAHDEYADIVAKDWTWKLGQPVA